MNRLSCQKNIKALVLASLFVCIALVACGCKPTEFFIDKIIAPQAEQVDENNENTILVNSPDAEEESTALAALDWTDDSTHSEDVQNLVTWSSSPNSVMSTHHSVFDPKPRFPGILASDSVALVFNADAEIEGEVDSDEDMDRDDVTATGKGKSEQEPEESDSTDPTSNPSDITTSGDAESRDNADGGTNTSNLAGNGGTGDLSGNAAGGTSENGSSSGNGEGEDVSDDPSDDPGRTPDYSGYGGEAKVLTTDDILADIPNANVVGVIGKQVAVMVQSIGGKGAIAAMSSFDYTLKEPNSSNSFADIFGANSNEWDSSSVYLWDGGSTSYDASICGEKIDLSGIDTAKFVEKVGFDGVVFYDQTAIPDINSALPEDLKKETYGYNITFMPLSFATKHDMTDSAYAVGQVLSESTSIAQSSVDMAEDYMDTVDSLSSAFSGLLSDEVWLNIAVDAQTAVPKTLSGISMGLQIVLFTDYGQDSYKPLNTWIKAAGVTPLTVNSSSERATGAGNISFLCPCNTTFSLEPTGTALARWNAASRMYNRMTPTSGTAGSTSGNKGGLGSSDVPYLVVTGAADDSTLSASVVRDQVKNSIKSFINSGSVTLYSAFPDGVPSGTGFTDTSIGMTVGGAQALSETKLIDATVHANPSGVLGSWTEQSFEGMLEIAWLAALYSESPDSSSPYQPDVDWSAFEATVAGQSVNGSGKSGMDIAREIMETFYAKYYRTTSYTSPDLNG